MCGIAGLYAFTATTAAEQQMRLDRMVSALHHRGPDGQGVRVQGPVALGHTRLSIIDLVGGAQPLSNEDGSVWVVFNGEIFNFVELRTELEAAGHRFATHSDTEVLVHLYEEHGEAFLQRLNGQFALALHDERRQRLLLARDRVGIRPLFYARQGGQLAFASEIKALFAGCPELPRRLAPHGLAAVFSLWSPLGGDTAFEGVHSLPPGHLMVVEAGGSRVQRYWDWPREAPIDAAWVAAGSLKLDEAAAQLHELLVDAVRLQLRSDVPVGAYLSGGLDSSAVSAIVRRYSDAHLRTFSLEFDSPEFDESAHQRAMAAHLGSEHSGVRVGAGDVAAAFARVVWHAETPLVRTGPAPLLLLADHVRRSGFKVVLTGEGADEVFAGYDLFKEAKIRRFLARAPQSRWRARLFERLYPYLAQSPTRSASLARSFFTAGPQDPSDPLYAHDARVRSTQRVLSFLTPQMQDALSTWQVGNAVSALLPPGFARAGDLSRDLYLEATTLLPGYLLASQGDRMAMAASIEARFPFLDHRVIEFAARLPASYRMLGLTEKRVLKRAMAHDLPAGIVGRTKQPYRAPDSASFFDAGQPLGWVQDLLSPTSLRQAGLFEPDLVARLVAKCADGKASGFADNMAFVGVLSTMLLHEQFVLGRGPA